MTMRPLRHILLFTTTLLLGLSLAAQESNQLVELPTRRITIAFMNTENLYDTLPSPFGGDKEFTPTGANRWDTERYNNKIENIARVIDDMGADMVGLAEVENETVVRDLVGALRDDYNYIHRTTSDSRGIDIALLYRGDRFIPDKVEQLSSNSSREILHVRGRIYGELFDLLVWHAPSQLNDFDRRLEAMRTLHHHADSLRSLTPHRRVVVMGDLNASPDDAVMRRSFGRRGRDGVTSDGWLMPIEGAGSYAYRGRWMLYDNIVIDSSSLHQGERVAGGVFVRDYLIEPSGNRTEGAGYPKRTFSEGRYNNGTSDHLPVFLNWEMAPAPADSPHRGQ